MSLNDPELREHAQAMVALLPMLMGRLFSLDDRMVRELPVAQLRVCVALKPGKRSMSSLARELGVSLSAMTQIADRLERAGLVRRVADARDRRTRHLRLTAEGEKRMRSREETHVRRMAEVLSALSPAARGEVRATLELLLDACAAREELPCSS